MPAVDIKEFARFILTGGTATAGNLIAVWIARHYTSFTVALVFGIFAGMTLSFVLTKFFAFQSRELSRTRGEALRFLMVYCFGLLVYWFVAMAASSVVAGGGVARASAEMLGVLAGASSMVVTGYLGHRFFTYRTHRMPGRG
jgi:putative flippase GtrA